MGNWINRGEEYNYSRQVLVSPNWVFPVIDWGSCGCWHLKEKSAYNENIASWSCKKSFTAFSIATTFLLRLLRPKSFLVLKIRSVRRQEIGISLVMPLQSYRNKMSSWLLAKINFRLTDEGMHFFAPDWSLHRGGLFALWNLKRWCKITKSLT